MSRIWTSKNNKAGRRGGLKRSSVKRIYSAYSKVYDALFKGLFYPRIEHAIQAMEIGPGERILDVGVGTGISLELFPKDCTVVGIDLSEKMLRRARDKVSEGGLSHIELMEMDAMNLDFPDDSFDRVFISHVVSVVPDPFRVMSEVRRVCRKGGQVVVVNHFKSPSRVGAAVGKAVNPVSKMIGWRSDLTMEDFIAGSGLRVVKQYKLRKVDFWNIVFAVNDK